MRLARIGPLPERGVDLDQHRFAEAARQPGARQAQQVAELAQAHALQGLPMLAAGAEQPDRRFLERLPRRREVEAARRRLHAREQRGTLRRRRGRHANGVAERAQRSIEASQQSFQAAEIAQAGPHFEQHRVGRRIGQGRRLQRHARRESERGVRHRPQGFGVALRVGLAEHDLRCEGKRRRPFQSGLDACGLRRRVGADDAMRFEKRDRPAGSVRPFARSERGRERLERERRKVQGDPEHGEEECEGRKPARTSRPMRIARTAASKGQSARARRELARRQAKLTKTASCRPRPASCALCERRRAASDNAGGSASCSGVSSGGPRRFRMRTRKASAPPA